MDNKEFEKKKIDDGTELKDVSGGILSGMIGFRSSKPPRSEAQWVQREKTLYNKAKTIYDLLDEEKKLNAKLNEKIKVLENKLKDQNDELKKYKLQNLD